MAEGHKIKPHAIMISIPYQGHLNPFVELAIKLASNGFRVTFAHTQYAHHMLSKSHEYNNDTRVDETDFFYEARESGLDIRYTTISDGFPLDFDRNLNMVEFWEHLLTDFIIHVDELVGKIVESIDPSLFAPFLIADTFQPWPAKIASKYNLVNVSFWTEPAMVFALTYHLDLLKENGHYPPKDNGEDNVIDYIPGVESISTKDLMSYLQEADSLPVLNKSVFGAFEDVKKADFILLNTVQELESNALSSLNRNQPTYAIGPVNFSADFINLKVSKSLLLETDCTQWLQTKPPGSVLYVSFGSLAQTNQHVIEEIAYGLLLSDINFIWVVRKDIVNSTDSGAIFPIGFEDKIMDKGLTVPWCDQSLVLSDPAIGGFLTHCGWNSVLESIWYGVPMICYPVIYDQPTNRKLVVDEWKIGINLCDGTSVTREEVGGKIKRLMGEETSCGFKHEIKKVKGTLHNAVGDDGSSRRNLDQFLKDLRAKILARK